WNPEIVNIREQVAFVDHNGDKMKDLIRGVVEKARVSKGISKKRIEIKNKKTLVIGAGVSGLEVARRIADSGYEVVVVEREPFLGGMVARLDRLYPEGTPNSHTLYPLINELIRHDNVNIFTNAAIEELNGGLGDYKVKVKVGEGGVIDCTLCGKCVNVCPITVDDHGIKRKAIYYVPTHPDAYAIDFEHCNLCGKCVEVCQGKIDLTDKTKEMELQVGSIVVATGLSPFDATKISEYGYGRYDGVLTALEFERKVANREIKPKSVVIINCAGSRDENYLPYCSRVCCLIGMKEAKLVKDTFKDTEVYLTYIDMRSYGHLENFYRTLRDTYGINFIKGRPSEIIRRDNKLVVKTEDILLGELLEIEADYVVLSTGFVPDEALFKKIGIPIGEEFPDEYISASLSVDSNPRGIYIAGAAACPRDVGESLIDANQVASSVVNLLSKNYVEIRTPLPEINSDICSAINCKLCVSTCPYGAIFVEDEEVKVTESICMGCGICTATCGAGANQLESYGDREILAQLKGTVNKGNIVAFLCKWSAYNAADKAGYERLKYPESVRIIRMPCTGRVDTQMALEAFRLGASSVLIAGCYPDSCHYRSGNFRARVRHTLSKEILTNFGIDSQRLRVEWIGKDESTKLVNLLNEMAV
ncbi:MAG TPA: hydrogenase iron-sulfur subunit, partial [bacterium (Candidatus Stahlbacteria)]|nr:hydrogenase iron-sulfur subunit [Candidatus Stahlbacteria bacterium]